MSSSVRSTGDRATPPSRILAPTRGTVAPSAPGRLARWLAARIQRLVEPVRVGLELWDGTTLYRGSRPPIGHLVVADRWTLYGLAVDPELQFGEAYMAGRLDIRGEFALVIEALTRVAPGSAWRGRLSALLNRGNSLARARHHVHHHYDLGNDFYRGWLDRELVYTCAYYRDSARTLDEAQRDKLDLVCRKLRLRPGEQIVEAGCGWGALALHMARYYGVRVKAFNVSREQLAYARARATEEGLTDRVAFIDDDYRNVQEPFDVFVSVGMLEHVGRKHFPCMAEILRRHLRRDGGRGLLHFIGRDVARPLNAWIRRRIFPGAYPPTLDEVSSRILAPAGLSVIDVENLRLHYARTLADWAARFTATGDTVRAKYGETFRRAWELYLAGSRAAFEVGNLQLYQVVFTPRGGAPPFWTRSDPFGPSGATG